QLAGSEDELLGLYEGINRVERGAGYHLATPDRITLFRRPILGEVRDGDRAAIRAEVRKTVIHEVAHHLGMDDAELEQLGGGPPKSTSGQFFRTCPRARSATASRAAR